MSTATTTDPFHIGQVDLSGREIVPLMVQDLAEITSVPDGLASIATLNEAEGQDRWFLLVGPVKCWTQCASCEGTETHHWMASDLAREDEDGELHLVEDEDGAPYMVLTCKHCDTWRTITDNDDDL